MSRSLAASVLAGMVRAFCAAALVLAGGCAVMTSMSPNDVGAHIDYMNRAAKAGPDAREQMKAEEERHARRRPIVTKLRIGLLLTSPGGNDADSRTGERMLREVLAEQRAVTPPLRNLVELRLQEVEARRALGAELQEIESKIQDLLSIESSMERKKSKSKIRPR